MRVEPDSASPAFDSDEARNHFLRANAEAVYDELTDGLSRAVRVEDPLEDAADRFPGLVPTAAAVEAERQHLQGDKQGLEIAYGLLLAHVLASPRAGAHLVWSMLRPTQEALARLDEFRTTGAVDLGTVRLRRDGRELDELIVECEASAEPVSRAELAARAQHALHAATGIDER
ncbi:MAG TPA: hypothetical protein VEX67_10450 [Solirubrobacteraceae bacterium]|nr:hypothetical protein [Solirubrobacteraceae bacterium]